MAEVQQENPVNHKLFKKPSVALDETMQNQETSSDEQSKLADKLSSVSMVEQTNSIYDAANAPAGQQDGAGGYFRPPVTFPFINMPLSAMQMATGYEGLDFDAQTRMLLKRQMEYYFSRQNLEKDSFLLSIMDDDTLSVPISRIAGFSRVAKLTTDLRLVTKTMQDSSKMEVNEEDMTVRPVFQPERLCLLIEQVPEVAQEEDLWELFGAESLTHFRPTSCEMKPNGVAEVHFSSECHALKALDIIKKVTLWGLPVSVRFQEPAPHSPSANGPNYVPFSSQQAKPPVHAPMVFVYPYAGVPPFVPPAYGNAAPIYNYGYPQYNPAMPAMFVPSNPGYGRQGSDEGEQVAPTGYVSDGRYGPRKQKHNPPSNLAAGSQAKPGPRKFVSVSKFNTKPSGPALSAAGMTASSPSSGLQTQQILPEDELSYESIEVAKQTRSTSATNSDVIGGNLGQRPVGAQRSSSRPATSRTPAGVSLTTTRTSASDDSNFESQTKSGKRNKSVPNRKFPSRSSDEAVGKASKRTSPSNRGRDDNGIAKQTITDLALNPLNFPPLVNSGTAPASAETWVPRVHNVWLGKNVAEIVKAPPPASVTSSAATSPLPTNTSNSPIRKNVPVPTTLDNSASRISSDQPLEDGQNATASISASPNNKASSAPASVTATALQVNDGVTKPVADAKKAALVGKAEPPTPATESDTVKKGPSSYASILKQTKDTARE